MESYTTVFRKKDTFTVLFFYTRPKLDLEAMVDRGIILYPLGRVTFLVDLLRPRVTLTFDLLMLKKLMV